jgi:hypothetical protein
MPAPPNAAARGEDAGLPLTTALDLLAYLITSAELCTREPLHYGMFRLIDAASRLAIGLEAAGAAVSRPWITDLRQTIDTNKELVMWDRPGFEAFLRDTVAALAEVSLHDRQEAQRA